MTAVELVTKTCTKCGEAKPLSEFHRNRGMRDGHRRECKECSRAYVADWQARRRAEMGDEQWRALAAERQRRSRERTGDENNKAYGRARRRATTTLIERHRDEFEHLLLLARRGEL